MSDPREWAALLESRDPATFRALALSLSPGDQEQLLYVTAGYNLWLEESRILLEMGVDPDGPGHFGAGFMAEVVDEFIDSYDDHDRSSKELRASMLRLGREFGADPDCCYPNGGPSPLEMVVLRPSVVLLEALGFEQDCGHRRFGEIDMSGEYAACHLTLAAQIEPINLWRVTRLFEEGANPNVSTAFGCSFLQLQVFRYIFWSRTRQSENEQLGELVSLAIRFGGDPEHRSMPGGLTALEIREPQKDARGDWVRNPVRSVVGTSALEMARRWYPRMLEGFSWRRRASHFSKSGSSRMSHAEDGVPLIEFTCSNDPAATNFQWYLATPPGQGAQGLPFGALPSSRVLDTRNTVGKVSTIDVNLTDAPGVASVAMNVTIVDPTSAGYTVVSPTGEVPLPTSSGNYAVGANTANFTINRVSGDGKVTIQLVGGTAYVIVDVVGFFGMTGSNAPIVSDSLNQLRNGNFENGLNYWTACDNAQDVVLQGGSRSFLDAPTPGNVASIRAKTQWGSMCQNVTVQPVPLKKYRVTARVRGSSTAPIAGSLRIWELGAFEFGGTQERKEAGFRALTGWQTLQADLCMSNFRNSSARVEIYVPAGREVIVDDITFAVLDDPSCSKLSNNVNGAYEYAGDLNTKPVPANGDFTGSASNPGLKCPSMDSTRGPCVTPAAGAWGWLPGPRQNVPGSAGGNGIDGCRLPVNFGESRGGWAEGLGENNTIAGSRGGTAIQMVRGTSLSPEEARICQVFPQFTAGVDNPLEFTAWLRSGSVEAVHGYLEISEYRTYGWVTSRTEFNVTNAYWQHVAVTYSAGLASGASEYGLTQVSIVVQTPTNTPLYIDEVGFTGKNMYTTPPPGVTGGGNPVPKGHAFAQGAFTPIEVPGQDLCLIEGATSWQLAARVTGRPTCAVFGPTLEPGGYLLQDKDEPSRCLSASANLLSWAPCATAVIWNDRDPVVTRNQYPDSNYIFPISFLQGGIAKCITRASAAVAVPVTIVDCGSVAAGTQLWTDPPAQITVTSDSVDTKNFSVQTNSFGGPESAYDYSPSVVGNRIFWCAGVDTDTLVSADLGTLGSFNINFKFAYSAPGRHPTIVYNTTGRPSQPVGKPVGYLACDPFAVATGDGYDVYFTRGVEDIGPRAVALDTNSPRPGAWNEIWLIRANRDAEFGYYIEVGPSTPDQPRRVLWVYNTATMIATAEQAAGKCSNTGYSLPEVDYGCGQPSIAQNDGSGPNILSYRVPRGLVPTSVVDGNQTSFTNANNPTLKIPVPTTPHGDEDGASPDVFWYEGLLYRLFGERGSVYFRRYAYSGAAGTLVREWQSECRPALASPSELPKTWRLGYSSSNALDGQIATERSQDNRIIVSPGRVVTYWGATIGGNSLGKGSIALPTTIPIPPTTLAGSTTSTPPPTTTLPCS